MYLHRILNYQYQLVSVLNSTVIVFQKSITYFVSEQFSCGVHILCPPISSECFRFEQEGKSADIIGDLMRLQCNSLWLLASW